MEDCLGRHEDSYTTSSCNIEYAYRHLLGYRRMGHKSSAFNRRTVLLSMNILHSDLNILHNDLSEGGPQTSRSATDALRVDALAAV